MTPTTTPVPTPAAADHATEHVDVAVIGAGFGGIAMGHRLKREGTRSFVLLERADDVGGTWRDNSYPGCACDVPSHLYSLSFALNPDWSRTYSPQPEIWAYLKDVVRKEGLLEHVRFGCEVREAAWDEAIARWRITTTKGAFLARALVSAAGPLTEPKLPDIPGLADFEGTLFHSARWNHEHDLAGERVAVVGTGASAVQFIPEIQPRVKELHVFQRTAAWVLPRTDRPITPVERFVYRNVPGTQRLMRRAVYWTREGLALPLRFPPLTDGIAVLGKAHLRVQVRDAELRRTLTPTFKPGCKRLLLSNTYLRALDQPNVDVIDEGLAEVRGRTVVAADGTEREVDTIILGTGFEVTDVPIAHHVRGKDGRLLSEHWADGMRAHRATTVAGFPNFFVLLGPNAGLGHTSVVYMAEAQAHYAMEVLRHLDASGAAAVEPRPEAQQAWSDDVQRRCANTVWVRGGCSSWYLDDRGELTTLWPDQTFRFREALSAVVPEELALTPMPAAVEPVAVTA
jgi:cation diffusion facilitator CzcD-associated flavoprotein CzcO